MLSNFYFQTHLAGTSYKVDHIYCEWIVVQVDKRLGKLVVSHMHKAL